MLCCLCCSYRPFPIRQEQCKIPLTSVSFKTIIQNAIGSLSILQTFENQEAKPIECEYIFTIPEDSLIQSLKVHLSSGLTLNAHVEAAEEALETYQDSISSGNTVALAKQEKDNKMNLLIGNLAPGESLKVEFSLVFPLNTDESYWKFSIPAGFLPVSENRRLDFDFSVLILSQSPIKDYSSNCKLDWQVSSDNQRLEGNVGGDVFRRFTDKHFWVKFKSEDTNQPTCLYQEVDGQVYAMLSFIPFHEEVTSLEDVEGKGEFLFVLDRSGSMRGDRIETAKKAAVLFLNSLPSGSLFNVVSFGSRFEMLHKTSIKNTSNNVQNAVKRISLFNSNMGGTNIYQPLAEIFCQKVNQDYPKTVFLITDGQVSNSSEVVSLIENNSGIARVHGFGIGEDVDSNLIKLSAKAGKGSANFITDSKEIGKKVISALQKCIFPCVNSWGIDWQGECYPSTEKLGSVYYGERCVQFILLSEKPTKPVTVRFFDNFKKEMKEFVVSDFQQIQGDSLMKLWNKAKIDFLMLNSEANHEEIKNISVMTGIPTSLTSLVCVVENEEAVSGEMVTRKVVKRTNSFIRPFLLPIRICTKFVSYFPERRSLNTCSSNQVEKSSKKSICATGQILRRANLCSGSSALESNKVKNVKIEEIKERPSKELNIKKDCTSQLRSTKKDDKNQGNNLYIQIISEVQSEGFWKYESFKKIFPKIDSLSQIIHEKLENHDLICTLYILATLHKNYQDKFEEWILLERKASRWLKSKGQDYKSQLELVLPLI